MQKITFIILIHFCLFGCQETERSISVEELHRIEYTSEVDNSKRDYFVYLPRGYHSSVQKQWPVMLFLHGNGERGNGKGELDYVLKNGPLYEAWIQKKDLPFIIISPQLHMFDFAQRGLGYIDNRQVTDIPQRLVTGVPKRPAGFTSNKSITRIPSIDDMSQVEPLLPLGWEETETDLLNILETVSNEYQVNRAKTYLTGLSYGGFGTWYMASKHPEKFAAIAPVVGWGHPSLMKPIAKQQLPVWQFAGGKDSAVQIQNFYAGLQELEQLGYSNVRFTVHEDMEHDAWVRVYSSDDLYQWLLSFSLENSN